MRAVAQIDKAADGATVRPSVRPLVGRRRCRWRTGRPLLHAAARSAHSVAARSHDAATAADGICDAAAVDPPHRTVHHTIMILAVVYTPVTLVRFKPPFYTNISLSADRCGRFTFRLRSIRFLRGLRGKFSVFCKEPQLSTHTL